MVDCGSLALNELKKVEDFLKGGDGHNTTSLTAAFGNWKIGGLGQGTTDCSQAMTENRENHMWAKQRVLNQWEKRGARVGHAPGPAKAGVVAPTGEGTRFRPPRPPAKVPILAVE